MLRSDRAWFWTCSRRCAIFWFAAWRPPGLPGFSVLATLSDIVSAVEHCWATEITTHSSDRRSPVMTPTLRRILLGMLIGLWAYVSVALNPTGTPVREDALLAAYGPYAWFGAYSALPCLCAVWAALAQQPLTARLPRAMACAAVLGLMGTWGYVRNRPEGKPDIDFLLMLLSTTCLQAMALALLRWRYGWQVRVEGDVEGDDGSQGRMQFSISQMFVWTTTTAALLALASCIVSDWRAVGETLREAKWLGATIGVLVLSALSLPLVIPSVGLVLGDGRRQRFAAWLLVMAVLMALATCLLVFNIGLAAGATSSDALFASLTVMPLLAGFLVALLGSLLVARLCGFRLVRCRDAPTGAPA